MKPKKHVVLTGGPGDGFIAYGPFDDWDSAHDYADALNNVDWWIMPVNEPEGAAQGKDSGESTRRVR